MKEKFIDFVKNEVGYKEGKNNDNKYGRYFKMNNLSWCALFVSYCARKCNIPTNIILNYSGCGTGYNFYKKQNRIYNTPEPGDIVFYKPTKKGATSSHTGVVIEVTNDYIRTVEGNSGSNTDGVYTFTYKKSYDNFLGFARPNYDNNKTNNKIDILYQAFDNNTKKWLSIITNYNNKTSNGYAGVIGHNIGGIRCKLSNNNKLYIRTHIKNKSWLSEITKWDETNKGYSGIKGKNIDAVMIKSNNYKISYRVHLKKDNRWLNWVTGYNINDKKNGYAGNLGSEIDAIQIRIL